MINHVHIIAFDMPYPPNYGGSTDMYFKLVSLRNLGVKVTLHVYLYDGKSLSKELEDSVDQLYYYPRKGGNPFWGKLPYIVSTRSDFSLLDRLRKDDAPILFEGLHTTFFVNHPDLAGRMMVVRAHNVEHNYYNALAIAEHFWLKKLFFLWEAWRLKRYEKVLHQVHGIAAISPMETDYFSGIYGKTSYIPAFHSNKEVTAKVGKGDYVLYHGNLSVPENNRAAIYLVEKVFSKLQVPCVVAGSRPSKHLQRSVAKHPHVRLVRDVPTQEILDLIQNAHVNCMVTFQSTGIKLKLLNSLYRGRFIVANMEMVDQTGLESLCFVGSNEKELIAHIQHAFSMEYTSDINMQRMNLLQESFNNDSNALKLAQLFNN